MASAPRALHHGNGFRPKMAHWHHAAAQKVMVVKRGSSSNSAYVGLAVFGALFLIYVGVHLFIAYRESDLYRRRNLRFVHTDHELDLVSSSSDEEALLPRRPATAAARNDRYIPNSLPEIIAFARNVPYPAPPYRARFSSQHNPLPHAVQ